MKRRKERSEQEQRDKLRQYLYIRFHGETDAEAKVEAELDRIFKKDEESKCSN